MNARRFIQRLVLAAQANVMPQYAPTLTVEAFITSRSDSESRRVHGTLRAKALQNDMLRRAWPEREINR